jgi:hypothetical protein
LILVVPGKAYRDDAVNDVAVDIFLPLCLGTVRGGMVPRLLNYKDG